MASTSPPASPLSARHARLARATIPRAAVIRDALASLDTSACQVVLVIDHEGRVAGLLTDGDIRRALLRGATLADGIGPIMRTDFSWVPPSSRRADVLDRMQSLRISEVPVLDPDRRLVGLHLLHDLVAHDQRDNCALIMAGGRGTRLAPLTDSLPKPMVPVAGRPILERIILHLVGAGVRRIFVSVHYLAHVIEEHFGNGESFGCRIEYLREDRPLGTAGALGLIEEPLAHPLLVMNGDLVTQADVGALLDFHASQSFAATMAVRRYLHTVPFGCIELEGHRVLKMEEKPTLERVVNAGIYVLAPSLVARVSAGTSALTMPDLLSLVMSEGGRVGAWEIEDDWLDVGQREQLERARGER